MELEVETVALKFPVLKVPFGVGVRSKATLWEERLREIASLTLAVMVRFLGVGVKVGAVAWASFKMVPLRTKMPTRDVRVVRKSMLRDNVKRLV